MSFNSRLVNNAQATGTLNIDTAVAGTITGGPTFLVQKCEPGSLSATVMVEAETSTITMAAVWEVSNDATTWRLCMPTNSAAYVVQGTGTAGDDAAVTRVIPANDAVYGWRYARCSIQNGVATGTANDKYSIAYNYSKPNWV